MPAVPLIGITATHAEASWNAWSRPASLVPSAYVELVGAAGGRPLLLPHLLGGRPGGPAEGPVSGPRESGGATGSDGAADVVAALDGLVLMGGNDVDPEGYGQEPHERAGGFDSGRDRWEGALLGEALERDLPVLAICRGHQVLNVHLGGTLHQHLPELVGHDGHRPAPGCFADVDVVTVSGTHTAEIFGECTRVQCSHHQAIDRIGRGLVASAYAVDGHSRRVIEAVEMPGRRFVVGVQWHPEESGDLRPFRALVQAGAVRAEG